ncbi:glycosyltransferase [Tessaracoccus caeni]|uniref:glycosyltransferase n=1 Tax=Tessaracoccus caeni TaxID=3031239 RepID=UPI0023DCA0B7|nr:glycosyltransferase [Tessaracoccus caeni]MDF1489387.1 glycosyltransferase [Tessaracoccus caeni]
MSTSPQRGREMPKVSVVVPVYNTEAFLAQCLDSLVGQSLEEIEIVVVNDGSPDGSQAIIDEYAERYPDKIVALTQPNGGLGSARNLGIAHATGRYIGFVDSDDFVELDMYRRLYEEAERTDSDVAICRYRHYSLDKSYDVVGGNFPFPEGEVFSSEGFFLNSRVMIVVNKIYRAELVRRVPFQDTWFEDVAWSPVVMSYADSISYTPEIFYHYILRDGTITTSHDNVRTLEEVSSLRFALANANPERIDQVAYMAAQRLLFDARVRPAYADKFALAVHEFRDIIGSSQHVLDEPRLFVRLQPYLAEDFQTIPKTVLFSSSGRAADVDGAWMDRFGYAADTNYLDVDSWVPPAEDPVATQLAHRPKALRNYLQLSHLSAHGGIVVGDDLETLGPIAWALHASRSFFGFEEPGKVSTRIFGAVPGAEVIDDLLALFRQHLEDADPLEAAFDAYFAGRAEWDYDAIESDFRAPYLELPDSCRVYATGVFINDFGLGLATTSLYPAPVTGDDGELLHYRTSPSHHEISRRISLDYAKWLTAKAKRKKPPAKPAPKPAAQQAPPVEPPAPPEPETPQETETNTPSPQPPRRRALGRLVALPKRLFGRRDKSGAAAKEDAPPSTPEATEEPSVAAAASTPPRPLVVGDPDAGLRILLYVGGFTTDTSAQRARSLTTWIRDIHGSGADIGVLFTDRNKEARTARAEALLADGIRLVRRTASPETDENPSLEWGRALQDERYDLLVVATPKGGLTEASILAAAPAGTRVLARLGQDYPESLEATFDVVVDKLSQVHAWVESHRSPSH